MVLSTLLGLKLHCYDAIVDPNIRVACLTCLGCIVSTPSPLLEVCQIIEPVRPSYRVSVNSTHLSTTSESVGANNPPLIGTDRLSPGIITPGMITPVLSGTQTPLTESLNSSVVEGEGSTVLPVTMTTSWLVRLCVRCIAPQLAVDSDGSRQPLSASQPLPVRLEALQLLTLLTKGYFVIVRCILLACGHFLQITVPNICTSLIVFFLRNVTFFLILSVL